MRPTVFVLFLAALAVGCADSKDPSVGVNNGQVDAGNNGNNGDPDAANNGNNGDPDAGNNGNNGGPDSDEDSIPDAEDNCPDEPNAAQLDGDNDGVGDACDNCVADSNDDQADDDEDGVGDACDVCAQVPDPDQADTDKDGFGDACDNCVELENDQTDVDADGIGDICDNCAEASNEDQADADEDGLGDACDNCPEQANLDQADGDEDGAGDTCDNCLETANPDQADTDEDGVGDICDNCDEIPNDVQADGDDDGVGDACDICPEDVDALQADTDEDGLGDACDNCPEVGNAAQDDQDEDDIGDLCDADLDGDGTDNDADNCANIPNEDQTDSDARFATALATEHAPRDPARDVELELSDDELGGPYALGFDFAFFGQTYDEVYVGSNGYLTFQAGDSEAVQTLPSPGAPNALIAAWWTDLNPEQGGEIVYGVVGEPGDREFVVSFVDVPHYFNSDPATFQIVLREADGAIEVHCTTCPGAELEHTQGVEDADGAHGAWIPGRILTTQALRNDAVRFTTTDIAISDGFGDACDNCAQRFSDDQTDTDEDGVGDVCDNCAEVINAEQEDTDEDALGDACDNCPEIANAQQTNTDLDELGDACDDDDDGDGVADEDDNCPLAANENQEDGDDDGFGNVCDNCPELSNDDQADLDEDGLGNICDGDRDGDDVENDLDNCPDTDNGRQGDGDDDGVGNLCDNCPTRGNEDQADFDEDGEGDVCDDDRDGDGIPQPRDNCPDVPNNAQRDSDRTYSGSQAQEEFVGYQAQDTALPLGDDQVSARIEFGFEFAFFGNAYDGAFVSSNGFLFFEQPHPSSPFPAALPSPGRRALIAPYWTDLAPNLGGSITYGTSGDEGERVFVLRFEDVPHFGSETLVTFSVALEEETGNVIIECDDCATDGGVATQGLLGPQGTFAVVRAERNQEPFAAQNERQVFTTDAVETDGGDACDNCPAEINYGQVDTDDNGDGDICDDTRIQTLQDPQADDHPEIGTEVTLNNVVVTVHQDGLLWVQEPRGAASHSGIFVIYESLPRGTRRGTRLNLVGTYTENEGDRAGLATLVASSIEEHDAGVETPLEPVLVDTEFLGGEGAEALESVLVRVETLFVTNQNPDGPEQDFGQYEVDGSVVIDNLLYRHPLNEATDATIESVTGVLDYAFGAYRLVPRDAEDVVGYLAPPISGLVLSEVFYDPLNADAGLEWVELYNGSDDAIVLDGYSLATAGSNYVVFAALTGTLEAGGCFVVGGPESNDGNGNPVYDQELLFDPAIQNGGPAADAVSLWVDFDNDVAPIDAVLYGDLVSNTNGLIDELGEVADVDIRDVPGGTSIERHAPTTWGFESRSPNPGDCTKLR
jgi:hypothetical protein